MILLDTHAWVWWLADPGRLGPEARRAIDEAVARDGALVSTISVWEVAMLATRVRLTLDRPVRAWIEAAELVRGFQFVPIDARVALESVLLGETLHPDPADRFIAATARVRDVPIVTADEKLRRCEALRTIW